MTTVRCVKAWEQGIWYHHLNGQGYGQNLFLEHITAFIWVQTLFHMKCENLTAFRKLSHCFSAFEEGGTQETYYQLHNMPVPIACCHIL